MFLLYHRGQSHREQNEHLWASKYEILSCKENMSSEPQELPEGKEEGSSGFQILTGGGGEDLKGRQARGSDGWPDNQPWPREVLCLAREHQLFVSLEQTFNK